MPDYIKYNAQGLIVQRWRSVDPNVVENETNILLIDRATYESLTKYHIVDSGQVREMTQAEKDALDQAEADAREQEELDRIDKLECKVEAVIIALVKRINVRIPSNPITREEVINQIKADR